MYITNIVLTKSNHVLKVKRAFNARQNRYIIVESTEPSLLNKMFTLYRTQDKNNNTQYEAVVFNKGKPYVLGYFVKQ